MPGRAASPPLRRALQGLGALALLLAILGPLLRPSRRPSPLVHIGEPCDFAVQVDGVLLCGAAAPASLTELCPGRGLPERPLRSGDRVHRDPLCQRGSSALQASRMDPEDLAALALPVDVNVASEAELASLPGIGPTLAARIAAARPFADTLDLLRVRGIGPVKLDAIEPRARVEPPQSP